jgi:hypothetical protein
MGAFWSWSLDGVILTRRAHRYSPDRVDRERIWVRSGDRPMLLLSRRVVGYINDNEAGGDTEGDHARNRRSACPFGVTGGAVSSPLRGAGSRPTADEPSVLPTGPATESGRRGDQIAARANSASCQRGRRWSRSVADSWPWNSAARSSYSSAGNSAEQIAKSTREQERLLTAYASIAKYVIAWQIAIQWELAPANAAHLRGNRPEPAWIAPDDEARAVVIMSAAVAEAMRDFNSAATSFRDAINDGGEETGREGALGRSALAAGEALLNAMRRELGAVGLLPPDIAPFPARTSDVHPPP